MKIFKTLDTRGLSFFNAFSETKKAIEDVKTNGILEIILDKKKNFTEAFQNLAESNGFKVSNRDEDSMLVRLFLMKPTR